MISLKFCKLLGMELVPYLERLQICYEQNVPLSRKTWIKTGGICACWITPDSIQQLKDVCSYLYQNNITFDLVGQTSNIFFHSTYNSDIVVSTVKVNQYEIKNDVIICDCGVSVIKLAMDCMAQGYAGFYGLVGLPGTVASAVVNNAGCFNCSISSMLLSADVLLPDGSVKTMMKEDFGYTKRSSIFKRKKDNGIILSVKLKLQRADNVDKELLKAENTKVWRKIHQEGYAKNLGSIYAKRQIRRNVKNILSAICIKTAGMLRIASPAVVQKRMLLWLYGYKDLDRYISDKNINTFVWGDQFAEQAFERYKQFMSEVYKNLEIEIEEKS